MPKKSFWPGQKWRILAHGVSGEGKKQTYTGQKLGLGTAFGEDNIGTGWEFDELVIDHWLHLEQMSERSWWLGVNGDVHIWFHIDGKGHVIVSLSNYGDGDKVTLELDGVSRG